MGHPLTRRPPSPPPRLVRSRSGSEKDSLSSIMNTTSQRFTTTTTTSSRSKSTVKSRTTSQRFTTRSSNQDQKTKEYSSDEFVRFLQRGTSPRDSPAKITKMPKSTAATSPSAWALSPGRSSMSLFGNYMFPAAATAEKLPAMVGGGERGKVKGGGGVSGVLKFFNRKKVSPAVKEEYHKFRVLQNRLMQWKFVNAKTEATMYSVKTVAEDNLFHVWLRILNVRSAIVENRIEIQRMKKDMKLCRIIDGQMSLLNNWKKLEVKNCEAVSRITRKVSALSVKMPLVDEAKGDVESIYEAMSIAMELMGNIVATITNFLSQVEKILYLLTELTTTLQLQEESLGEVEKIVTFLSLLFVKERSVRIHLIQQVME